MVDASTQTFAGERREGQPALRPRPGFADSPLDLLPGFPVNLQIPLCTYYLDFGKFADSPSYLLPGFSVNLQIPLCTYYLDYSQLVNGLPTPFFEGLLLWGVLCLGVPFEGLLFLFIITWRNSLPNVSYCTLVPRSYRGNFSYVIP